MIKIILLDDYKRSPIIALEHKMISMKIIVKSIECGNDLLFRRKIVSLSSF